MSKRNLDSGSYRWLSTLFGLILLLMAAGLLYGGVYLTALGGSWYYVIAGGVLLITAFQLLRGRRSGFVIYAGFCVATFAWALYECGWNPIALLPRVLFFLVLLIAMLLTWRWLGRAFVCHGGPVRGTKPLALVGLGLTAVIVAIFVLGLQPHAGVDNAGTWADHPAGDMPADTASIASGDWPNYGRTPGGQRYSPLDQITPANVAELSLAWTFNTGAVGRPQGSKPGEFMFEATPLKVRDKLVLCTPHAEVVAVSPESGEPIWRFNPRADVTSAPFLACRGVSYDQTPGATGLCAHRILTATLDAKMYALDADTGQRCPEFGQNGEIDLTAGMGLVKPGFYYVTSPPSIVHGKAVVGGWVADNVERGEPSGVVRAFDTRTGALAWAFDMGRQDRTTLPPEGEHYTRATPNVWAPISADPALGLVYLPTGNETPDFFGGGRQAVSGKYASSVIAVDADSGEIRWHFQTTHHDIWDYDVPAQPTAIDLPGDHGGPQVPALLVPTKRGELFVLDRRTGKPLTQVEERPVPQQAVPGEHPSPTQPFQVDMPSFAPATLRETDMWGATPLDQLYCRIRFKQLRNEGLFTPPSLQGSLAYPGSAGVFEWGGVSVDPLRHIVVTNNNYMAIIDKLTPRADVVAGGSSTGGDFGGPQLGTPYAASAAPFLSPLAIPCNQPPWGMIAALDLKTRTFLWRHPLGTAYDNGPFGIASHVPLQVGVPNMGGSVITRSGLIFIAASADRTLRAFELRTGRELWHATLPFGGIATPSVYEGKDGRQYVVIAAGGHTGLGRAGGDAVMAYALPKSDAK
ncbi:membrane-bound PQQ-dependent dehydrogenase, glucose/quinate/shikimate family [Dyella tabacisoli]|uniref:Membrane-bound PQQ-dependent dehydrogenase, glucose/quinate/shikimate family n=1 Tax=Dyella tabacisoli TaxID=2282381 RepID=A0A369UL25_9GAMM|nr:membrane-bound PQQ-dependent dehydrogenase, glucose/quinate/shikimate family [Dyella tabacisoli]RDD81464.1 membrane-bound PQQ-dependent dehydrogenase, glucose/quinate/shikimate family [Dyella tabacisoli]